LSSSAFAVTGRNCVQRNAASTPNRKYFDIVAPQQRLGFLIMEWRRL
jgi:hypothetical protein